MDDSEPHLVRSTDWLYRRWNLATNDVLMSPRCKLLLPEPDTLVASASAQLSQLLEHHEELVAYRSIGYELNPDNSHELQLAVRLRLIDLFGKKSLWIRTLVFNTREQTGPDPTTIPKRLKQRAAKMLDDETDQVAKLCIERLGVIERYRAARNGR